MFEVHHGTETMWGRFKEWLRDRKNPPVHCDSWEDMGGKIQEGINAKGGYNGMEVVGFETGDGKSAPLITLYFGKKKGNGA